MKKFSLQVALAICAIVAPIAARANSAFDYFDRADAAVPGPAWNVLDGSVSIDSNRAQSTTGAASNMIYIGSSEKNVRMEAVISSAGPGVKSVAFITRYNTPADCYHVTVEDSDGDGLFDRIQWFYGINGLKGFSDGPIVGANTTHFAFARVIVNVVGGVVNVGLDLDLNGVAEVTFTADNMPLGDGAGVGLGFSGAASADSFFFQPSPLAPIHFPIATKAMPVPGAGVNPQIAAGAVWTGFGVPAISDVAPIAFIGKWSAPKNGVIPAQTGTGAFVNNLLLLKVGAALPGAGSGNIPADATVKSMKDPILAKNNADALIPVTIKGTGITPANDVAIVWVPFNNVNGATVVVREGDLMPGGSAAILAIKGVAVTSDGVIFNVSLRVGSGAPAVTTANDNAVFGWESGSPAYLIAREGDDLGHGTIKSYKTLVAASGSPGDGRGWTGRGEPGPLTIGLLATYTDGAKSILTTDGSDTVEQITTGQAIGNPPGGTFKALGLPSWQFQSALPVFLGTASTGVKGVYEYDGAESALVAKLGDVVDTLALKAIKDPVQGFAGGFATSICTVTGAGVDSLSDSVVVRFGLSGDTHHVIAREGSHAPDTALAAVWKSFTSVASPNSGPFVLGTLRQGTGGVTAANDVGVWGKNYGIHGELRSIFREGDSINGKTLKSFVALKAVSGSPGTTRCWTENGIRIVWRATFSDGSTAIMLTILPSP